MKPALAVRLLAMLKQRGYGFVALDQALKDPAYERNDHYTGPGGITWLHHWALTEGRSGRFFAGEPRCPEAIQELAGIQE